MFIEILNINPSSHLNQEVMRMFLSSNTESAV
jgi:hypothetical protein